MNTTEICLPPLAATAPTIERSGFTLLRRDGDPVIQGEPIAFCSLYMHPEATPSVVMPLVDQIDYHLIIVAPNSGTLSWNPDLSLGGWKDWLPFGSGIEWKEQLYLGRIAAPHFVEEPPLPEDRRLLFCSGRRMVPSSDTRGGILPGWYDRVRAWNAQNVSNSLFIAATCQIRPAIFGDTRTFHELLTRAQIPTHLTFLSEGLLVPTAHTILEGLLRSEEDCSTNATLIQSWYETLRAADRAISAAHLTFILGALSNPSPLDETPVVLQVEGLRRVTQPARVVLSLDSEGADTYQHKTLPFSLSIPPYLYNLLGTDLRGILLREFDLKPPPSPNELANTYRQLSRHLAAKGSRVFILNSVVLERGTPLFLPGTRQGLTTSTSHRIRELNKMLYSLEDEGALTVLDVDSLSASLGTSIIPDGAHGNRTFVQGMQDLVLKHLAGGEK